jgi:hypothetical protein
VPHLRRAKRSPRPGRRPLPPCPAAAARTPSAAFGPSSLTGRTPKSHPGPGDTGCCGSHPGAAGCAGPGSCCGRTQG